jgi:hypothetical protein
MGLRCASQIWRPKPRKEQETLTGVDHPSTDQAVDPTHTPTDQETIGSKNSPEAGKDRRGRHVVPMSLEMPCGKGEEAGSGNDLGSLSNFLNTVQGRQVPLFGG